MSATQGQVERPGSEGVELAGDGQEPTLREYEEFANLSFQVPLLTRLLDLVGISPEQDIVDLGCGTGMVTRAVLARRGQDASGQMYAVDPEPAMIEQGRRAVEESAAGIVSWLVGRAEELDRLIQPVDRVVFCNAIHLVEDKAAALRAIFAALRPGGRLAFNSAYSQDHNPPEADGFYIAWLRQALRVLRRDHPGFKRERTGERPLADANLISLAGYVELVRSVGFRVVADEIEAVPMPLESWVDISAYSRFVRGALPGVPLEWAAAALQEAARRVFQHLGLSSVPRNWVQIVAERP